MGNENAFLLIMQLQSVGDGWLIGHHFKSVYYVRSFKAVFK